MKSNQISRRSMLKSTAATLVSMTILPTGMVIGARSSWAATPEALEPSTFATLVQMSRDIYPHDRIGDEIYAKAVMNFDKQAADSEDAKAMFENGVAELDAKAKNAHNVRYVDVAWEKQRVALLEELESTSFFQAVRGSLITGIYNNKDVWPIFGYEGESFSQGGYLYRGFDDIDWLESV